MNQQITTDAPTSAHSRLPALTEQNIKVAHFRYKAVPLPLTNSQEDFFDKVDLPKYEVHCINTGEQEEACVYPFGGVTAAFKINPETGEVEVGLSKCSIQDTYNKKTGRMISQGRFTNAKHAHVRFPSLLRFNINAALATKVKVEGRNASAIARDMLVFYLNNGLLKDADTDMAHIRSYVAVRSAIPFIVELS